MTASDQDAAGPASAKAESSPRRMVGILGGMGPLATADFLRELVLATPAARDADHIPVILSSVPQIPDRVGPILNGTGPSPLPALQRELDRLIAAGAECVVMPCNTAHYWIDDLRARSRVPFLSIVDAALAAVAARVSAPASVGLIGTTATVKAGMFQNALSAAGYACIEPAAAEQSDLVSSAIALVKRNRVAEATPLIRDAVARLEAAGAATTLLACTEVPAALRDDPGWLDAHCVDATAALARAAVEWALRR